jgi:tetratricopeptide (TPR) repeat protein
MMRFVLLFLVLATPVHACLQVYRTTLDGKRKVIEAMPLPTTLEMINGLAADKSAFWEGERKKSAAGKDFESRNDHAVALLHLRRTAQAIPILETLERERPGVYQTAANLGTAYELAGRNADALRWIREGIRRNTNAHAGTEWVHVAILEAKLAQARDPKWLETHSVLALDFGPEAVPRKPGRFPNGNDGKPVTAKALHDAIHYQLLERRQFVGPPDPYVADLFFDWANLAALTTSLEEAVSFYDESLRFGAPRAPLARKRLAHMKRVIRRAG